MTTAQSEKWCATEFNVPTSLLDDSDYKSRIKMSKEISEYKFDFNPGPQCYMTGIPLQGLRMAADRKPPPAVIDVETYLRQAPLLINTDIDDVRSKLPPKLPEILSNKMIIPDCRDILKSERTKVKKLEQPDFKTRIEQQMSRQNVMYMLPGRDTRMELRDAFKKWEKKQPTKTFGIGKYDTESLQPVVDVPCDSQTDSKLPCMFVLSANQKGTTIDPTISVGNLQTYSNATAAEYTGTPKVVYQPTGFRSAQTLAVAKSIDPDVPYLQMLEETQREIGKKVADSFRR